MERTSIFEKHNTFGKLGARTNLQVGTVEPDRHPRAATFERIAHWREIEPGPENENETPGHAQGLPRHFPAGHHPPPCRPVHRTETGQRRDGFTRTENLARQAGGTTLPGGGGQRAPGGYRNYQTLSGDRRMKPYFTSTHGNSLGAPRSFENESIGGGGHRSARALLTAFLPPGARYPPLPTPFKPAASSGVGSAYGHERDPPDPGGLHTWRLAADGCRREKASHESVCWRIRGDRLNLTAVCRRLLEMLLI